MYHVLLTNRYLTTRVIPFIAVAAVALCVALVIIVVSVMTGFLDMVKTSGQTLMGHVVVSWPVSGIPHYERLIERIEALPEAEAAAPIVDGWGLLKMPYPAGPSKETETVQFWAVDPESFARVTRYGEKLYWRAYGDEERAVMGADDFRLELHDELGDAVLDAVYHEGLDLRRRAEDGSSRPGIAPGMHVSIGNERQRDGSYRPVRRHWWLPGHEVVLTTLPVDTATVDPQPESVALAVVNEFVSGVYLIDDKRTIIPIEVGQRLLHLDEQERVNDEGEVIGKDPARATMVLVRAREGVTPEELRERVADVYDQFRSSLLADESVPTEVLPPPEGSGVQIQTWLQQQRAFIAPIEKERELMRVLFSIIYLVCAGLVLSIFWAIVYEKTRDIGILRSIGASRAGISFIFLRYGAIVGTVGAVLGLGLAVLVVRNINWLHTALGEPAPYWLWSGVLALAVGAIAVTATRVRRRSLLPVLMWSLFAVALAGTGVGLMLHRGTLIWDPSVYYFSEIPNEVDRVTAITTMIGAVVFSVLGAFLPAARAADTDPVRALRYE